MNWRRFVVAVTVALVLTTVASSVQAGEDSGTETLAFMEHVAVEIDGTDGSTRVTWDIEVTDGVPVNVWFMPEEGYEDYVDPMEYEFSYYADHSKNHTTEFRRTVTVNEGIVYYLVIENVGYSSMDTSTVEYEVTWDVAGGFLEPWCWPLIIIIMVIIGGMGYWMWRRRQGSGILTPPSEAGGPGDEGPMEAPAPGTGTYYPPGRGTYYPPVEGQTELSPQPEPPDTPTDDPGYTGSGEPPAPGTGTVPTTPEYSVDGTILLDPESSRPHLPSVSEGPAPGTGVHQPSGEGLVELSPQPEPPDAPTGGPPAPGTATVPIPPEPTAPLYEPPPPAEPTIEGTARLGPVSDPPHLPSVSEGPAELGPQPEPPDIPPDDPGYGGSGEPPAPGTGTVPPDPTAPIYEPPPLTEKPPEPDTGHEFQKKGKPP